MTTIVDALEQGPGYFVGLRFQPDELARIRKLIRNQWLQRIAQLSPEALTQFEAIELPRYHELSHLLDHGSVWPKAQRILGSAAVEEIRSMSVMRQLEAQFGRFEISDEENIGHEEIYWRLVRPDGPTDVGPMHADAWFWNLGHGSTPEGCRRVKVGFVLYPTPTNANGLITVSKNTASSNHKSICGTTN
jgi:hypothetical protein